jgi:hypothetical protein
VSLGGVRNSKKTPIRGCHVHEDGKDERECAEEDEEAVNVHFEWVQLSDGISTTEVEKDAHCDEQPWWRC